MSKLLLNPNNGYMIYYYDFGKDHLIHKEALLFISKHASNSNKKSTECYNLISLLIPELVNEIQFVKYSEIPNKALRIFKLSKEELFDALSVFDYRSNKDSNLRIALIHEIISKATKRNWEKYWHLYSKNRPLDRSVLLAKSHAYYVEVLNLKFSKKEILEASVNIDISYRISNYNYFVEKLKRIKTGVSSIQEEVVYHSENRESRKFKPELIDKAETQYVKEFTTHDEILLEVNRSAKKLGLDPVKIGVIKTHFAKTETKNRLDLVRYGDDHHKNHMEASIHLDKPKYKDDYYMIDGSRIQIPYFDENENKVDFLSVFVIFDVASSKVVGYAVDQYENHKMVLSAFDRVLSIHGCIAKEIVRDNAPHYRAKKFKQFVSVSKKLGTYWDVTSNPSAKSNVESFFRYFGKKISKKVPGYIGLGIKCTSPDSRRERSRIKKIIKGKKTLIRKIELIKKVDELINYYNNLGTKKRKSPMEKYSLMNRKNAITIGDRERVLLTWEYRTTTVRKTDVKKELHEVDTFYPLSEKNVIKYNEEKIRIYQRDDSEYVFCFTKDLEFIERIRAFETINPMRSTRTKKEDRQLNKLLKERRDRKTHIIEKVKETEKRVKDNEAKIIPFEIIDDCYDTKSEEYTAHKEFTLKTLETQNPNKRYLKRSGNKISRPKIESHRLYKPLD